MMIDTLAEWSRIILSPVLDPLLWLGHDAALVIMAVLEALCVVLVRKYTTDQKSLQALAHDRTLQKHFQQVAKMTGDTAAAARHQALRTTIALRGIKYEGFPLLITIPVVLFLAAWCLVRLPSIPTADQQQVTVAFYDHRLSRAAGEDRVVHLVVPDGVTVDGGPVRALRPVTDPAETQGLPPYSESTWKVSAPASATPYTLKFIDGDKVLEHKLLVGQKTYYPPVSTHPEAPHATTEVRLAEFRLFGFFPGLGMFPPWMFAYLCIIVPFFFIWKSVLKVA